MSICVDHLYVAALVLLRIFSVSRIVLELPSQTVASSLNTHVTRFRDVRLLQVMSPSAFSYNAVESWRLDFSLLRPFHSNCKQLLTIVTSVYVISGTG